MAALIFEPDSESGCALIHALLPVDYTHEALFRQEL